MERMIDRILHFDSQDWKHIRYCLKVMVKGFFNGDWVDMIEGWEFLKLHLNCIENYINDNGIPVRVFECDHCGAMWEVEDKERI